MKFEFEFGVGLFPFRPLNLNLLGCVQIKCVELVDVESFHGTPIHFLHKFT